MKCARVQELFSSYAENAMEPPLRVAFEQHLAECQSCRARYENFNATLMMLEEMPEIEVPAGFHAAVMARVEQSTPSVARPVRWWHLDWQRVFTVRVPARALAAGVAALLVAGLVVQLTPLNSVTANLLFPQREVTSPAGVDPGAPKIGTIDQNSICLDVAESGLSVCVDTSSVGAVAGSYSLRFEAQGDSPVKFEVYLMPANATSQDTEGTLFYSGFVQSKQDATVGVASGQTAVARVSWERDGKSYRQFVFMPSRFSAVAATRSITVDSGSVYSALRQVAEAYGVVVLASGDLNARSSYRGGVDHTPADALYGVVQGTGLAWDGAGTSIYVVKPGS